MPLRAASSFVALDDPLTEPQRARIRWLRAEIDDLARLPLPGAGATRVRWQALVDVSRADLAAARLVEGHVDALAILHELGAARIIGPGDAWGVWAAQPDLVTATPRAGGWHLHGTKGWCSGAIGLDRALVTARAPDGPRLFVVAPHELELEPGSWEPIGMAASASHTMRFDLTVTEGAAVGAPNAYVGRSGFWHGGAGVAACWFGGAIGVLEALRARVAASDDPLDAAAFGRCRARLDAAGALLSQSADAIDAAPDDVLGARERAMSVRLAVEEAARDVLHTTVTALGASPLARDDDHSRRVADLQVYLRQLNAGHAAQEYGRAYASKSFSW